ncbi:MAG: glycoside hydrolase family 97 protein [Muribaculaceae bacterium]|nr:glycoside hydrolase family 97 protein [Muribaculaceae bacterium]
MKIKIALATILAIYSSTDMAYAAKRSIKSPDGKLEVITDVKAGTPTYMVKYLDKIMIDESPLGFKADIGDFSSGMTDVKQVERNVRKHYNQDRIKRSDIDYEANVLEVTYADADGRQMMVEWQVSDNNVAFRYHIPNGKERRSAVIEKEESSFKFPPYTTTFITPQSNPMIGWKRTKPSYEEPYTNDSPMSAKSLYGKGYTFPALFHVGNDGWVLLSETGVDGNYCGSRLSECKDGTYSIAYPMEGENNGNGSSSPGISLPGTTPWRTITVGNTLDPIVETTIPWDLVEPLYETKAATAPGRGTWSWLLWQDGSINYEDQVKFIDLAANMGYENALIDNWWDKNIGKDGIERLSAYARSKNVNLILWFSSSGYWNDIEQSPTNVMSRPIPRKKAMKWMQDNGISKIKVDFFGGDKQETIRLYEDILSDANDYGISVIFHGCTLPRGWERMYPNYIGSEAVLASENLVFGQDFCNNEAFNATLHPFIRNAVGSMEYGGTILNHRLNRDNNGGTIRMTTDAFQLATAILFQNPVQNFALAPNNLEDAPAAAIEFMKNVPTTWDDTKLIKGYPGKYVVLARRNKNKWYVSGVNATSDKLKLRLDLSSILPNGRQTAPVYVSDKNEGVKTKSVKIKNGIASELTVLPSDGFVMIIDAD